MNKKYFSRILLMGLVMMLGVAVVDAQPTGDVKPVPKGEAVIGENRAGFDAGGSNTWTYEGTAGEILTVIVEAQKPANKADQATRDEERLLDTEVFVYDPDGDVLGSNDDIVDAVLTNSFLRYVELKTTGTYTIEVTNWFRAAGDETEGRYTLILHSNKNKRAERVILSRIVSDITTATEVMDTLTTIIEEFDTNTILLVNPTYCTITDATFGDLSFDLEPYSGIIVEVPKGWYNLRGKGDVCDLNSDEINVPRETVIMITRFDDLREPPDDVQFPIDEDALANS